MNVNEHAPEALIASSPSPSMSCDGMCVPQLWGLLDLPISITSLSLPLVAPVSLRCSWTMGISSGPGYYFWPWGEPLPNSL